MTNDECLMTNGEPGAGDSSGTMDARPVAVQKIEDRWVFPTQALMREPGIQGRLVIIQSNHGPLILQRVSVIVCGPAEGSLVTQLVHPSEIARWQP